MVGKNQEYSLSKIRAFLVPTLDSYTILLSAASAVGFGFAVGGVTFLDSYVNLFSGTPVSYPLGYFVLIFTIPEFYLTYRLTSIKRSFFHAKDARLELPITRAVSSLLVPLAVAFALCPNFLPEFPHLGLVMMSFLTGAFTSTGIYLHEVRRAFDFSFVRDEEVDRRARIEVLKLNYATWYDALKLIVTIYIAIVGVFLVYGRQIMMTTWSGNQVFVFSRLTFAGYFIIFYTIFLVVGILGQMFGAMSDIQDQLLKIRIAK